MRRHLLIALVVASAVGVLAPAAEAIVVDMNALGQSTVTYNPADQSGYVGAALVPGTCSDLLSNPTCAALSGAGVPTVTAGAPCNDPALTADLVLPNTGICSHGGSVMGQNETFALTWDAHRSHWSTTRDYVEQFLRDVADASGSLGSPYAVTSQYTAAGVRAQNSSKFGGGCIDFGNAGGSACEFGAATGAGHDFPANGCTPGGDSFTAVNLVSTNSVCLTDPQLQSYLAPMINQVGLVNRTQPGYTPVVTVLMPPGVEICLDATKKLCSANGYLIPPPANVSPGTSSGTIPAGAYDVEITYNTASGEEPPSAAADVSLGGAGQITVSSPPSATGATGWYVYIKPTGTGSYVRAAGPTPIGTPVTLTGLPGVGAAPPNVLAFCSYHSQVQVGSSKVAYLVQPWTAGTQCDEPGLPAPPDPLSDPVGFAQNIGLRLVSPLSQAHIGSIVNPGLSGWFGLNGSEINDGGVNGYACHPLGPKYDTTTFGSNAYVLQREFNNAGVIENDPNTYFGCAPNVLLTPSFVVPSGINQGEEVQFDGSTTTSTLIVPNSGYQWDFGDGTKATGPSVIHTYAQGGTYTATLTVTDRGNNTKTLSQTIQVLGPDGLPVNPGTGPGSPTPGPSGGGTPPPTKTVFHAGLQLMPQSLRAVLRRGISLRVTSNMSADGFAKITITRALAKRLGIRRGRLPYVVIGQGTLSGKVTNGTVQLRVHLPRSVVKKLTKLRHVTLTIHLSLVAPGGGRQGLVAAGRY